MANSKKNARRPDAKQVAAQRNPGGTGQTAAQRNAALRQKRRRSSQAAKLGWISVGVVLVVVAVFVVIKVTSSPNTTTPSATGDAAGRNPALAPASVTGPLSTVPLSSFNSVGTAGMPTTLTVTAKQPVLTSGGLPRFVYDGAEFCPYSAMDRWAMVAALYRFGTFTGLKQIVSSPTDDAYQSIPTLSFLRSSYKSKYLVFTPYEDEDIDENPLMTVPSEVQALYSKYDAPASGAAGTSFDGGQGGIPFIDIANQYVSAGTPGIYSGVANVLQKNGLTHAQIAQAINQPSSAVGTAMDAKYLVGEANYLSAGISAVDGQKPASVCTSSGVKAAAAALKATKPISG